MAAGVALRKRIQRRFKICGFTLKVNALDAAYSFVSSFSAASASSSPAAEDDATDLLIDEIRRSAPSSSSILPASAVLLAASLLSAADSAVPAPSSPAPLSVVDAFLVPRFRYDPIRNVFYQHAAGLPLHGEAGDKADLYRDRFQLLLQRLRRDEFFSRPALFDVEMTEGESSEVTPIQSLIGCTGRKWITGVISQLEDGRFYLEDLSAAVPIDLSNAIYQMILPQKYLGNPLYLQSPKWRDYSFLIDRVAAKLTGWKYKMLSHTGRELEVGLYQCYPTSTSNSSVFTISGIGCLSR